MESENKLSMIDVMIQKKEGAYFLSAPAENCVVSDESIDGAYEKLLALIEKINREKEEAGIQMESLSIQYMNKPEKNMLREVGMFFYKSIILAVILFVVLQIGFSLISENKLVPDPELVSGPLYSPLKTIVHSSDQNENKPDAALDGSIQPHSFWEPPGIIYPFTLELENISGETVMGYFLNAGELASRMPSEWTFYALIDDKWVILDTRSNESGWVPEERRNYTFTEEQNFSQFKFTFTDGAELFRVYELGINK